MDDAARVVGAVLDDDGKLSKLVVEQEDHTVRQVDVPTIPSDILSSAEHAGSAGIGAGIKFDYVWPGVAVVGDLLEIALADEPYWGVISVPSLTEEGVFGFNFRGSFSPVGSIATRINWALVVSGDYDGEGGAGIDVALFEDTYLGVPAGGDVTFAASGLTPPLSVGCNFVFRTTVTTAGTVQVSTMKLSLWKMR